MLLLVLLGLGSSIRSGPPLKPSDALIVELVRESSRSGSPSPKPAVAEQPKPKPPRPLPRLPKPAAPPNRPLDLLVLSREEMAAADISRLGTAAGRGVAVASNTDDDSAVVGRGPRGEMLYAAEWARKPTSTELGGYLPANAQDGYGLVACRTAPQNRVEDCVELENFPRGSRLASAVRQAAWQFRVKPPRKNGRPLIGEWVRIRIDYTRVEGVRL